MLPGCGGGDAGRPAPARRTTPETRRALETAGQPVEAGQTPVPAAEGWGTLHGRFVLEGTPPELPPLPFTAGNDAFCIGKAPANKAIVRGEKDGLVNAVVYLRLGRNETTKIHPDYEAEFEKPVVLDNNGCEFHPRVVLVRTGQPLVIKNSDPTGHNTKLEGYFNDTIASHEERTETFNKTAALPLPINCGIHPFMLGHMVIQDHPYMAVSGDDGSFEIKNIPAGQHEFQFWHEQGGNLSNLSLPSGATDRRGRAGITIQAGETLDLGEIKVPASLLR